MQVFPSLARIGPAEDDLAGYSKDNKGHGYNSQYTPAPGLITV